MRDIMSGAVLTALSLFALVWLIPAGVEGAGQAAGIALSPSFWPSVVAAMGMVFGIVLTIQAIAKRLQARQLVSHESSNAGNAQPAEDGEINWRMLLAVVLLVPYYYLTVHLGLLLASIAAFMAYSVLAGERNFRSVACWALIGPVTITLFFITVAQVLIPLGPLSRFF